jgi:hypothetical protein
MRSAGILWAGLVLILLCASAASARITDEQVQSAIQRIIERLYQLQNERGTWDPEQANPDTKDHTFGANYGGMTAIATYALLTAGESYQSPRLKRAIDFLATAELKGTYAVGLANHVWANLPPRFEPQMKKNTEWLLGAVGGGPAKGGYTYLSLQGMVNPGSSAPGGPFDNSNTQYGVLGVWEAAKRGLPVPQGYWQRIGQHFTQMQHEDGGWSYVYPVAPPGNSFLSNLGRYGSMTAGGLACLFIVQDYLHTDDFRRPGVTRSHPLTLNIQKGLDWFDQHFKPNENPSVGGTALGDVYYYLMGVERIGLASGYKHFGEHDWYAEGAEILMRSPGNQPYQLAFSLLFLVRGRVPVYANKLRLPDYDWNNRPRDVARIAAWISDELEQEVNWQIVNIGASPEQWLDAPILYIASHEPLKLSDEQALKIKRYIDLGGLVVTTADSASTSFTESVRKLYEKLYPDLKLGRLSPEDEMMDVTFRIKGNAMGSLSLHNGVRHLAIHIPRDASWIFHSSHHGDPQPWQFMANIYSYATEKGQARPRLAEHFVTRRGSGGGPRIDIARVRYEGSWNPEPLAWEVQSNVMFNEHKADVATKVVAMEELDAAGVRFAHIAGIDRVTFSEAQLAALKRYVEGGGVVLFETVGGRGEFTGGMAQALAELAPDSRPRPLAIQSAPVTGQGFGGHDVGRINYRAFTILRTGRFTSPRLQVIEVAGRPAIFISNEDLTMGMLGKNVHGIYGYDISSSRRIMSNLVLWSQSQRANP